MHMSETLLALKSCYITSARAGAAFRLHIYNENLPWSFGERGKGFAMPYIQCDSPSWEYDIDAVLDNRGTSGLAIWRQEKDLTAGPSRPRH